MRLCRRTVRKAYGFPSGNPSHFFPEAAPQEKVFELSGSGKASLTALCGGEAATPVDQVVNQHFSRPSMGRRSFLVIRNLLQG